MNIFKFIMVFLFDTFIDCAIMYFIVVDFLIKSRPALISFAVLIFLIYEVRESISRYNEYSVKYLKN